MINKILNIIKTKPLLTIESSPSPELPPSYFQYEKVIIKLICSCSEEELHLISRMCSISFVEDPYPKATQENVLEFFKQSFKRYYQYSSPIEEIEREVNRRMGFLTANIYEIKQNISNPLFKYNILTAYDYYYS